MQLCPCGSQQEYLHCCGLLIEKKQFPMTPEALMRSRYTAFTQNNVDYIMRTMKEPAAERMDEAGIRERAKKIKWIKLEVIATQWENQSSKGFVEFKAFYSRNNHTHVLHEISEFHYENGQWFYVDGKFPE